MVRGGIPLLLLLINMVSADHTDQYATPVAPSHLRRRRSTCTPPRKPSAKIVRVMLSESPDNIYNVLTRRTSRSAKRALPFTQGITTPPPSTKSRTAVLASLRGRAAAVRLDFDNIKPSPEPKEACNLDPTTEQHVKMATVAAPPAGSVTPPLPVVCVVHCGASHARRVIGGAQVKRVKRRKHDVREAAKAATENRSLDHPTPEAKEPTTRVTRSTALATKPNVHGRVRRLWR